MRFKKVEMGQYLISQGTKLTNVYLLVEGKLQVEHYEKDGNRAVLKVRKYLAFRAESDGQVIQLEKREVIAAMLGISVRQLNRTLRALEEEGLIQFKNKTVKVLDAALLSDISPTDFLSRLIHTPLFLFMCCHKSNSSFFPET